MAGLLQYEGSKVPEAVQRAAQAYLYGQDSTSMNQARAAQQAASEAASRGNWTDGQRVPTGEGFRGLMSKLGQGVSYLGRAAGGVSAAAELGQDLNESYGPAKYNAIHDILQKDADSKEAREIMSADPEIAQRGADTAQRVSDRAMSGVKGLMEQARQLPKEVARDPVVGADLLMQAGAAKDKAIPLPKESTDAVESVAAAAPEIEAGRQRIQAGALQGLQSGEVHISDLAKSVVEADQQRAGTEMKPEEKTQAVTAEIQAMKTMDKSQLSEYVSYALIAGGLLASVLDKSGGAGQAFHESLNKQLDRNLQAGKMKAALAQAQVENQLAARKQDNAERSTESQIKDRDRKGDQKDRELGQGDSRLKQGERGLDIKEFTANESAQAARGRLGLMGEANDIRREGLQIRRDALAAKKLGTPLKGEALSTKDAGASVDAWASEKGIKLEKGARSDLMQQLRNAARDPSTKDYALGDILDTLQDSYTTSPGGFFTSPRVKRPKE